MLIVLVSQYSILVIIFALAKLASEGKIDLFVVSIASFVNRPEIEP